jgi:hypothetical protein
MKIITYGKIPAPEVAWWVGQTVECPNCKLRAELELGDKVRVSVFKNTNRDGIHIAAHLEIVCPTPDCGKIIWLYEPGKPIYRAATGVDMSAPTALREYQTNRDPNQTST